MMSREIVVNGRFLSRRITGVERYGREILRRFRSKPRVVVTRAQGLAGHAWEQFILPVKLNSKSMLWSPANIGPLFVRAQAVTIHDLIPLEHPEWFQPAFSLWYRVCLPILIRRVAVVFTPSAYVRSQIKQRFGRSQVTITPNGVDATHFHPAAQQTRYALPERYILFVGTLQPGKNLQGLLNAWQTLQQEFTDTWLVVAGAYNPLFRTDSSAQAERVLYLGYVDDADLPALYAQALVFVLPSINEGFGLPVLEAQACGTPVLVSNGGALPEVVGDTGLVFDLTQPESLTDALQQYLNDANLRSLLRERGLARAELFSWQNTADLVWITLHER